MGAAAEAEVKVNAEIQATTLHKLRDDRPSPAELFAKYDKDSNGAVDVDEVFKLFNACNYTLKLMTGFDVELVIKLMAKHGNGMEEALHFEQFSTMLRALDKRILFKQCDENGSGAIDAFELASMLKECGHESSPDFVASLIERHTKSGKALAELDAKGGENLALPSGLGFGGRAMYVDDTDVLGGTHGDAGLPAKGGKYDDAGVSLGGETDMHEGPEHGKHSERNNVDSHVKELRALGWSDLNRQLVDRGLPDRGSTSDLAHRLALALDARTPSEGCGGTAADSAAAPSPPSSFLSSLFGYSSSPSSAPTSLVEAFKKYDEDGGGTIDCDELAALLRDCGLKDLATADVEELFAEADADGSGEIDFDEFKKMIATLEAREAKYRKSGESSSYLGWMLPGGGSSPASTVAASASPAAADKGKRDGDAGGASSSFSSMLFGPSLSSSSAPDDDVRTAALVAAFTKYDEDGGGTIEDFELAFLLRDCGHKDLAAGDVRKLFAEADVDGSGGIDFDEFKQMVAALEAREAEHRESGESSSYLGWMLPGGGRALTPPSSFEV